MRRTLFYTKKFLRALFLIALGGMLYYNMEILVRGYSHISMIFCGGMSFYCIGLLNESDAFKPSLLTQMIIGSFIITFFELITGILVNLNMHLSVWDYSKVPFNYRGQICLPFSVLWFFAAPFCILLDDFIRCVLFGRKHPDYYAHIIHGRMLHRSE